MKCLSLWLMYFQPTSSTESSLNIEARTFNLYSFACVQKILYMKMHVSRCSDPILLCLYPQIPRTFAFLQHVWGILGAIFPAWECGRSPRVEHSPGTWLWFWVLDCASASPCSLTGYRGVVSPILPAEPPSPSKRVLGKATTQICHIMTLL